MRYEQLIVLEGCNFFHDEEQKKTFYAIFKDHGFRKPKVVGVQTTLPDKDISGKDVPGTGGRKDLFFYIDGRDLRKFSIWALLYGFRYFEDLYYNGDLEIYPKDFVDKFKRRW